MQVRKLQKPSVRSGQHCFWIHSLPHVFFSTPLMYITTLFLDHLCSPSSFSGMANHFHLLATLLFIAMSISLEGKLGESATTFTIVNRCKETIWPGITSGLNFSGGGFALKSGGTTTFTAADVWGGRIWGRTGCNFDNNGHGDCQTGACGTALNCTAPGKPPASIADFNLGDIDYYDVSLVDGFNLPITITPINGTGNCSVAGCDTDLRQKCPDELALKTGGKVVACKSACEAFDTDQYCCRGAYGDPVSCAATNYSRSFKEACPIAYSYAYDDPTSVLTCNAPEYVITFCSSRNQTECSYHDKKLNCNASKGTKMGSRTWWWVLILALPSMINLGLPTR